MIIDCSIEFKIRQLVNMSQRLIKEYGYTGRIWVTIEEDADTALGYSVVLVDVATHEKLKVNADKLYAYYNTKPLSEYLSNLSPA